MSERHLYIVTGASRGLGEAIALRLMAPGHRLLCIARRRSDRLDAAAQRAGAACDHWALDLVDPRPAAARLQAWLAATPPESLASATLINNAAALTPSVPFADADAAEVSAALRVNLEAPMLLTGAFLQATAAWPGRRRVVNISSGLGRRAMASQAPYCAAKAGLDHFSRAVALDEARRPGGARIVSLAPGVIDTDMQQQLRDGDPAAFPDQPRFAGLQRQAQLQSADAAAALVLAYLDRPDFGSNPVADVRDA